MVTPLAFNFASTPHIVFGTGSLKKLQSLVPQHSSNVILITGNQSFQKSNFAKTLWDQLSSFTIHHFCIKGEPTPTVIDQIVAQTKGKAVDCAIGIGGGSVLDAAKAVSAMLKEEGSVKDYLEGVGTKEPSGKKIPLIAIPTTSGTGSEVTKNAVISEFGSQGFKKSLRHNNYIPNVALVDPELTLKCSPQITAATGMDAFTQLLESYLSTTSNAMTDSLAFSGLEQIACSLSKAVGNGNDIEARTGMSYAAMVSGITLANSGLGLSHGFAQPLGSLFPTPHGVVCAVLMGAVNRKTVQKLINQNNDYYLKKYEKVARLFVEENKDNSEKVIYEFIDIIEGFVRDFRIPKLSEYGVKNVDFDAITAQTGHKNHPINFTEVELKQILADCL